MLFSCIAFCAASHPPAICDNPSMPHKSKHSKTAQQQCQNTYAQAFGALPTKAQSPDGSDIYVLNDESDPSVIYIDSSKDLESDDEVGTVEASVEALQHLYLVFCLPTCAWRQRREASMVK
jgi:hypothetical protein